MVLAICIAVILSFVFTVVFIRFDFFTKLTEKFKRKKSEYKTEEEIIENRQDKDNKKLENKKQKKQKKQKPAVIDKNTDIQTPVKFDTDTAINEENLELQESSTATYANFKNDKDLLKSEFKEEFDDDDFEKLFEMFEEEEIDDLANKYLPSKSKINFFEPRRLSNRRSPTSINTSGYNPSNVFETDISSAFSSNLGGELPVNQLENLDYLKDSYQIDQTPDTIFDGGAFTQTDSIKETFLALPSEIKAMILTDIFKRKVD